MRNMFVLMTAISLLLLPTVAYAQEEVVVENGISVTSPFYFLTQMYEEMTVLFTLNEEKKMEKRLEFAEKKLSQLESLNGEMDEEAVEKLQNMYEKHMEKALRIAEKRAEKLQERLQRVQQAREKHMLVLERVLEKAPEEAKGGLENAIENSFKKYDEVNREVREEKSGEQGVSQEREGVKKQVQDLRNNIENRKGQR
jgi:hypothetical protein